MGFKAAPMKPIASEPLARELPYPKLLDFLIAILD